MTATQGENYEPANTQGPIPPGSQPAAHLPLIIRVANLEHQLDTLQALHNRLADAVTSELGL